MPNSSNGLKTFVVHRPLLFVLLMTVISLALDRVVPLLSFFSVSKYAIAIIILLVQIGFAVGMLAWLGWIRKVGFNGPSQWHHLSLLWLPALLALVDLAELFFFHASSFSLALYAGLFALFTAVNEEALSRGLIFQALLPYGPLRAAVLSGILFGLLHLNNLFNLGFSPLVFIQAIGAGLMGIGFAAYRFRTNTLWPLIIMHACYDLATDIAMFAGSSSSRSHGVPPFSPWVLAIALIIPGLLHAGYGLFLLRSGKEAGEKRVVDGEGVIDAGVGASN